MLASQEFENLKPAKRPSRRLGLSALFLLLYLSACLPAAGEDLYGPRGVQPRAVRQGTLGSCYFHAVIAAMAQAQPQALQAMIQEGADGTYTVKFADGKKEVAYPEDLKYTRESGYDLSQGLWVAVLFRAYAQRVLRESLLIAIDHSDLFALLKKPVEEFVASNDALLLAYDRAIRSQVDQYGNIDRTKLETRLKTELKPLAVSDEIKDSVVKMLESGGFFDSMVEAIKQNGELFGAYRAVGQGGIAERVMQTFAGNLAFHANESESTAATALAGELKAQHPIVVCSGASQYYDMVGAGQKLPDETKGWYVNAHCYTVLSYDPDERAVTLRNPWAHHPDPDGVFQIPLRLFVPAYRGVISAE